MLSFDPYAIFFRPLSRCYYAGCDTLQIPSLFYLRCDIADSVIIAPQMKAGSALNLASFQYQHLLTVSFTYSIDFYSNSDFYCSDCYV